VGLQEGSGATSTHFPTTTHRERQNIRICAAKSLPSTELLSAPNGGYVRGYQEPPAVVSTTAEQAGGQTACLCIVGEGAARDYGLGHVRGRTGHPVPSPGC
jgi:hypothetical protein